MGLTIDHNSLAGRITALLGDLREQGRISGAEASVVTDLLWHPDLPEFFKMPSGVPMIRRASEAPQPISVDHKGHYEPR